MRKFEAGQTYKETMTMADREYDALCVNRTAKTATFKVNGNTFTKKIRGCYCDRESIFTESSIIEA